VARFDRTIPPGGEGKITLQVRTKGFQGKMHKKARVLSNDPKHPQVTIGLKGKVWVPIHVNPRYVRLRGAEDDEIEVVVLLRGEKKESLVAKIASISIPDKVDVKLQETQKGRTYDLKVKNKVKWGAKYRGTVKLTTNYPEKPEIVIQVMGDIRGLLEVRPTVLNFGRMSQERLVQLKDNPRAMTRSVTVLLNKGDDLKVERVELEKSIFRFSAGKTQPGRMVQIMVEPVVEKLKKGANEDRLKIYTNQKGREVLEVPIRFDLLQQ
jgi:hypothetical protein